MSPSENHTPGATAVTLGNNCFSLVFKRVGYSLVRSTGELRARAPEIRHAPVLPRQATYSPWLTDKDFQGTFDRVKNNTLVTSSGVTSFGH